MSKQIKEKVFMNNEEFNKTIELMKACGFPDEFIIAVKAVRFLIRSGKLHEVIQLIREGYEYESRN